MKWSKVPITSYVEVVIKMNNKGFTLIELLAVILIIGIIFGVTFYLTKGTTATTLTQLEEVSDAQIFEAARAYVAEANKSFNGEGYTCVTLQELFDYGYIKNISSPDKIIKLTRNPSTKVIQEIKYVNECN